MDRHTASALAEYHRFSAKYNQTACLLHCHFVTYWSWSCL